MLVEKDGTEAGLCDVLAMMARSRGWDFRQYKTSSVTRRVAKRLRALNLDSYGDYLAVLQADPAEYNKLLSSVTIKVSEFFRDSPVFGLLGGSIKELFPAGEPLRVWSCGCANGEEAYSLAITLFENLAKGALEATKVFATDIDAEAIENARRGLYGKEFLRNCGATALEKYFFENGGTYGVRYNIRNMVRFGRLDIVRDSTLTNMHIVFCRNLFIYFNRELQEFAFQKLDYALRPGGVLVMGKAEKLPQSFAGRYAAINSRHNIYRKMV